MSLVLETRDDGCWLVEVALSKPYCCQCGQSVEYLSYQSRVKALVILPVPAVVGATKGVIYEGTEEDRLVDMLLEELSERPGEMAVFRETAWARCRSDHGWDCAVTVCRVGRSPSWQPKQIETEVGS